MNKFNVKAFTLTAGITWGLSMMLLAWVSSFGWGIRDVSMISGIYLGYTPTFIGGIVGALWGFVDGAIGGFIFSVIYNFFVKKVKK
ncbi:MAG: bacteriophage holin [Parachlamydiales bacterium]|nr:bacteriophage holin [Parachlamydiales bacterium]